MLTYNEYEREVLNWLIERNEATGSTFSLSKVGPKGAEVDYFIDIEGSRCFAATFWDIPVSFSSSSGDLIQLVFRYTENKLDYFFKCNHPEESHNLQNQYALELLQNLKKSLEEKYGLEIPFDTDGKMYSFQIKPMRGSCGNIEDLLKDVDTQLPVFVGIVDSLMAALKSKYPDFKASQITAEDFMSRSSAVRSKIEKQSAREGNNQEIVSRGNVSKELFDIIHTNLEQSKYYFAGLDTIIEKINLKPHDQRVYYNYRERRLIFAAGQRYVWCIDKKANYLRYISKAPIEAIYEPFVNGKEAYLNSTRDFPRQDIFDLTIAPIQETLASTTVSGFLRHNKADFEKMVFDKEFRQTVFDKTIHAIEEDLVNHEHENIAPLNQILFGPPGTGKTYYTINKALAIIERKSIELLRHEKREDLRSRFQQYVESGQIVFTTFHQSMNYEDFVEGIKPLIEEDSNGNKQVVYEIKPGIFKQLVEHIHRNEKSGGDLESYTFDEAWNELLELIDEADEKGSEYRLDTLTLNSGMLVKRNAYKNGLILKPSKVDARNYTVSYKKAKKLQQVFPDLSVVKIIDKEFAAIIGGMNSTAYWAVLNFINNRIGEKKSLAAPHAGRSHRDYVLIIDEINRGNVSAIFGELITLIEDSKRQGKAEELEVKLPYSKDCFSVPSNLYIVGTMNTADRSVEALDAALRRRFIFEEMVPKYDLQGLRYSIFDFTAADILRRINLRIEKLIGRDHCIGHAYFIDKDATTIIDSFYTNIIPLLQEYFFGDYGKIGLILGKGFVRKKRTEKSTFANFDYEYKEDLESKSIYEIVDYREEQEDDGSFGKAIRDLMA